MSNKKKLSPIDSLLQKEFTRKQFLGLGIIATTSMFGITRIFKDIKGYAATIASSPSFETEDGTLSGGASIASDTSASSGEAVTYKATPVLSSTVGDSGINQTLVASKTQTGTNVVQISAATGAGFSAAGAGNIASLPAGTFYTSAMTENGGGSAYATGAAIGTAISGIYGTGSASTIIALPANTIPPTESADTSYMISQGKNGSFGGGGQVPGSYTIDGVTFQGVTSSADYGGFYIYGAGANGTFTMSNTTIAAGKGSGSSPPAETAQFNLQRAGGVINLTNVTVDGQNQAAAGLETNYMGMNTGSATFTGRNLLFKNTAKSGGFCMHGNVNGSTTNLYNIVMQSCKRNFGCEANGGDVNIYDPLWDDVGNGGFGHDFNITWTLNNYEGLISVYFTTQANWNAFIANRTNKKFTVVDNFQAYGDATGALNTAYGGSKRIQDYFKVYIAGTLVGTGNSAYASGFAH